MRSLLVEETASSGAFYVVAPRLDISRPDSALVGPFIEAGDVLVLGKIAFAGASGLASDIAGFLWLQYFEHAIVHVPLQS
jgi:glycine amidinotransferase